MCYLEKEMRSQQKKDFDILHKIYDEVQRLNKELGLKQIWKVDNGFFETRIDISENGEYDIGNGKLPDNGFEMFCPDLICFKNKLIIEYEEEAQPHSGYAGAKLNKGHFPELLNKRDTIRDDYYKRAGFTLLKVWEGDIRHKLLDQYITNFITSSGNTLTKKQA